MTCFGDRSFTKRVAGFALLCLCIASPVAALANDGEIMPSTTKEPLELDQQTVERKTDSSPEEGSNTFPVEVLLRDGASGERKPVAASLIQ